MKAFVIEKDLSTVIKEIAEPLIQPYEAKCKILACGLCGSDKKFLHGIPYTKPLIPYPLVPGHESVGQVVEIGSHVTSFKVGDIVTCPFNFAPKGYAGAWGSFAEYGTVLDGCAVGYAGANAGLVENISKKQRVMPDRFDIKQIPMFTVMRETLGAIRHFGFEAGQSIVVYGLGPIGASFIKFLSLKGLYPIIAIDIDDEKVEAAMSFGADYGFHGKEPDLANKILELSPKGVNHVLDAAGIPDEWNFMLPLLSEDGQLAVFGVPEARQGLIIWDVMKYWNFKLNFFQMSNPRDEGWAHSQVLAYIKSGAIDLSDYISNYFPFEEMVSVAQRFLNNEFKKKVIVTF